jgi:hypothetical protein
VTGVAGSETKEASAKGVVREFSAVGPFRLALGGKRAIARAMYARGTNFLGGSILLARAGGYHYVVLHLLCQGIECMLKGILLFADYDKHEPKLRSEYRHDLEELVAVVVAQFGRKPLRGRLSMELGQLSNLYQRHLLRYGTTRDIFIDPDSVRYERVLRRAIAIVRLVGRQLEAEKRAETPEA